MRHNRALLSVLLLAVCIGSAGCTEQAKPEPQPPVQDEPAPDKKDILAEQPTALPVDELYPSEYVQTLVKEAEQMAASLADVSIPTELTNVNGRMKQELGTAREKVTAGAMTQAVVTATNAKTYAFGMQKYLDYQASSEQVKQETERLLAELERGLKRQKAQVEQLDALAGEYATFTLLTVLEKQLGSSLLHDTRTSWEQTLQDGDEHLLFTTFMNLGNLTYQQERVDLLLKQAEDDSQGKQKIRDEIAPWLEREIPVLLAEAEQKTAAYEGDVNQGYRSAYNAVSQAQAAKTELQAGHTAYALELYLSARVDLGAARQLERVGTQPNNQPEIPLTELAELRADVLHHFDQTAQLVEQGAKAGSDQAWYLSKLYDANAQIQFADNILKTKVLAEAVPDKMDAGQVYQMLVTAQTICQLVDQHIKVGIDLSEGNLESKHKKSN